MVYAEVTLKNVIDEGFAREGYIKPEDVRTVAVTAVVDTGSMNLVITEELFKKLGLAVKEERTVHIANGQRLKCKVAEAVEVKWKDRFMILPAVVVPGAEKVLLGAIALEGMDLMVNPVTQELTGINGDKIIHFAL